MPATKVWSSICPLAHHPALVFTHCGIWTPGDACPACVGGIWIIPCLIRYCIPDANVESSMEFCDHHLALFLTHWGIDIWPVLAGVVVVVLTSPVGDDGLLGDAGCPLPDPPARAMTPESWVTVDGITRLPLAMPTLEVSGRPVGPTTDVMLASSV